MKKHIGFLLVLCLAVLLVATLVACNPNTENPLGPDSGFSTSSYTVTFDLNGADFTFDELGTIDNVKYGDTIPEPLHDGKPIVLQKKGYVFKGWTVGSTDFEFGVTQIMSNTTIRAKFEAKKYYHILDIYSTVKYEDGKYVTDANGHATKDAGGNPVMSDNVLKNSLGEEVKNSLGTTTRVPETDITLSSSAMGENTNIYSTYNATTPSRVSVPTRPEVDGNKDNFCFWYYLTDYVNDKNETEKRPVQFTEWASEGATEVSVRSVTYTYDEPLTLYAMFESDLPKVTVEYYDSEDASSPLKDGEQYRLGKNILEEEKYVPEAKENKDFNYWYFVYTTKDKDDNDVRNEQEYVFDVLDEDGKSTNKDATSLMDAAFNSYNSANPDAEIPTAEQNFRDVTLKLYANWVEKRTISTKDEYKALAQEISGYIAQIEAAEQGAPEDVAEKLDSLLKATIQISGDIDFGGEELQPLFDEAHPFKGIIDGGKYTENEDGEKTLESRYALTNATVTGDADASFFGYVNGTIKNLSISNCTFATTTASTCHIGAFASVSGGAFENCHASELTFRPAQGTELAYIGGIVGQLSGTANDDEKGSISECSVTMTVSSVTAKGIYLGGFAGESGSSTNIKNSSATLTVNGVVAQNEQGASSGLRIGGLAGNSTATVTACEADVTISSMQANGTALIGGLLGQSAGSVERSFSSLTIRSDADVKLNTVGPLQTVAIGGFIGLNEGSIINSYSNADIALTFTKDHPVYVGGLVGSNNSARSDSSSDKETGAGAINRSYSTGAIVVTMDKAVTSANLYVGGIAGFSKHSKFARNFTLANITVTYATQNADLIHAGFLFGSLGNDATITSGYYAYENVIAINGKQYHGSDYIPKTDENADSSAEQEGESKDAVLSLGTSRPAADFANKEVLFGTDDENNDLGWVGGNEEDASKNVWELKDDAKLPTLVDIGCTQE